MNSKYMVAALAFGAALSASGAYAASSDGGSGMQGSRVGAAEAITAIAGDGSELNYSVDAHSRAVVKVAANTKKKPPSENNEDENDDNGGSDSGNDK